MKEYAVYKGEEILGIGTAKELAEKLNVKPKTVQFWSTPANHKRNQTSTANRKIAIVLEKEDD